MELKNLISCIAAGKIEAELEGVDYKSSWQQHHGKDLSAIGNHEKIATGWIVVGVDDDGRLLGKDKSWLKKVESDVSAHIRQYLEPSWAVKRQFGEEINGSCCLFIEIENPQDVVKWNGKAYKLVGTASEEMRQHEILALSLRLPGTDFSKAKYNGKYDSSLITEFAEQVTSNSDDFQMDVSSTPPNEILSKLNIIGTNTAGILFGAFPFRIVHFNEDGDILDQRTKQGLFHILSEDFIEEIQSRSRTKGTSVKGSRIAAAEEEPYPLKALREIFANAVAHALYQRDSGDIVVETHPNRITVSNNCTLEAKAFVDKWFSRIHKPMNKHLMNTLRVPKITDEQGSGKMRVFRLMLEDGKREPIVEFHSLGGYGKWSITLFNEEKNKELKLISEELSSHFADRDQRRIATALLLWRNKKWTEIEHYLDEHFQYVAEEVLKNKSCPVSRWEDQLYTKRWAQTRLTGKVTKQFTEGEKNMLLRLLKSITEANNGHISSEEARKYIGLSDSRSESTQLARLFAEWRDQGHMEQLKKGQWRFINQSA